MHIVAQHKISHMMRLLVEKGGDGLIRVSNE